MNDNFSHIGDIIKNVMKSHGNDPKMSLGQISDMWRNIVGKEIRANTHPVTFKNKFLVVNVTSSTWVHQLQFLKQDIINKINDTSEKTLVKEIRFKVGPI